MIPLPALPRFTHQQVRVVPQLGFDVGNAAPPQGDTWLHQQTQREHPLPPERRDAQSASLQESSRTGPPRAACVRTDEPAQSAALEPEFVPFRVSSTAEDRTHQIAEDQDRPGSLQQQEPQREQMPGRADGTPVEQPTPKQSHRAAQPAEERQSAVGERSQDIQLTDGQPQLTGAHSEPTLVQSQCGLEQISGPASLLAPEGAEHSGSHLETDDRVPGTDSSPARTCDSQNEPRVSTSEPRPQPHQGCQESEVLLLASQGEEPGRTFTEETT